MESHYIGDEAESKRPLLIVKHPIEWGLVTNWDLMEKIWNHTFSRCLCIEPSEHPVAMVESACTPKINTEKTVQIMFESFNVPALFIGGHSSMSMVSSGRSSLTGMVLDFGEGSMHSVPLYEGYTLRNALARSYLNGPMLQTHLSSLMNFTTYQEYRTMRQVMSNGLCFVSQDYEADMAKPDELFQRSFKPFGMEEISISKARFQCMEPIFQPNLINLEFPSLPEEINRIISRIDVELRPQMWRQILITGGISRTPGLATRMKMELEKLTQEKVEVFTHPHGGNAAWMGLKECSELPNFSDLCIPKEWYDEEGPALAHRFFLR
jgi:actin-related protein